MKKIFLSLILCLCTAIPVFADIPNVTLYAETDITGGVTLAETLVAEQVVEIWHYSGGYWGNNYCKILDSDFEKTEGGVADLNSSLTLTDYPFLFYIEKGSEVEQAIEDGREVHVNIKAQDDDLHLTSLFDFETEKNDLGMDVIKTNSDGSLSSDNGFASIEYDYSRKQYVIKLTLDPKLNYYSEEDLSYKLHYGLPLNKWVPFVANGYGWQAYSVFGRDTNGSGGGVYGWVDFENPWDYETTMPDLELNGKTYENGFIHPSMILNTTGWLVDDWNIVITSESTSALLGNRVYKKQWDSGDTKIGLNTFVNAGAVGLHFVYPVELDIYVEPAGPLVKASYVEVVGVSSDGLPLFNQLSAEEYVLSKDAGNVLGLDEIKDVSNGRAYLSDWVLAGVDIPLSDLEWEEVLPEDSSNSVTTEETGASIVENRLFMQFPQVLFSSALFSRGGEALIDWVDRELGTLYVGGKSYDTLSSLYEEIVSTKSKDNSIKYALSNVNTRVGNQSMDVYSIISSLWNFAIVYMSPDGEASITASPQSVSAAALTSAQSGIGNGNTSVSVSGSEVLYVRYLVVPEQKVRTFTEIYDQNNNLITTTVTTETIVVDSDYITDYEIVLDPDVKLIKWETSKDAPILNTMPTSPIQSGTGVDVVLTTGENLYIKCRKDIVTTSSAPSSGLLVEQWRLSKYTDNIGWTSTANMTMNLPAGDSRSHSTAKLNYRTSNFGYVYNVVDPVVPIYLHSKALTKGTYEIGLTSPSVTVDMSGDLNIMKVTPDFSIVAAKWLTKNSSELLGYSISTAVLPTNYTGGSTKTYNDSLDYGIVNVNTYTYSKPYYRHTPVNQAPPLRSYSKCKCGVNHITIGLTNYVTYTPATYDLDTTIDRYIPSNSDPVNVASEGSGYSDGLSGFASAFYQTGTVLNVYPEVAMLFEADGGSESVTWVVGDEVREMNAPVYHTATLTPYMTPTVSYQSIIDTRIKNNVSAMYKGATTTIGYIPKPSNNLVVETWALDISDNVGGVNLKSSWGASSYNTEVYHNNFISSWEGTDKLFSGLASSSMTIPTKGYIGAESSQSINFTQLNTQSAEYGLIIRSGEIVGVEYNGTKIPISSLASDHAVVRAIKGLHLDEIFSVFESNEGAVLTEGTYETAVNSAIKLADGFATDNLESGNGTTTGDGWYNEDCTTLVIKRYVTTYSVPSTTFIDKTSISINGLAYSSTGTIATADGHLELEYVLSTDEMSKYIGKEIDVGFIYNTNEYGTIYGEYGSKYKVAAISVLDSTF